MNMHLKFRRLLSETLERRQLFSADLGYQFDSFHSDTWESDYGTTHFQQFMLVRGIKSGGPATELKGDSSHEPDFKLSSSERDSSELRSTPRGNRGRMSGEAEFAPARVAPPTFNAGGVSTIDAQTDRGFQNSNDSILGQPSAVFRVATVTLVVSNNKPSSGNSASFQNPSTNSNLPPTSNSSSNDSSLIQRGSGNGGGSSRSQLSYFDSSSTSQNNRLTTTTLQSSSTDTLGQATRLSLSGITSKLNQAIVSESVNGYHQTSTDSALIDITGLADNQLGSKLNASPARSWKLAEQSIKNLKSLSRTNAEVENTFVANSDLVMANWIENTNGLIDVACRRDPIARIVRPADAIEVSARLESKVGLYQVFDVIDDRDYNRNSHASQDLVNSKEIVALESIDWGISRDLAPAVKTDGDSQSSSESGDTSFRKPFFITSVLAVFSGHLLRSRRKQAALKPK